MKRARPSPRAQPRRERAIRRAVELTVPQLPPLDRKHLRPVGTQRKSRRHLYTQEHVTPTTGEFHAREARRSWKATEGMGRCVGRDHLRKEHVTNGEPRRVAHVAVTRVGWVRVWMVPPRDMQVLGRGGEGDLGRTLAGEPASERAELPLEVLCARWHTCTHTGLGA